ncbi:MAG: virulence RhuM family protein [Spirochaetales bacterium]|nr:virulence RhuM family protein [Spirochaetales bacterium]
MEQNKYEIVKFVDNGFELEVNVSPSEDTVWLKADEMAMLFDVNRTSILRHANNIIQTGELEKSTCAVFAQVQNEGGRTIKRETKIYNLDMIIAVGYRVNSKRGTVFRQWAKRSFP